MVVAFCCCLLLFSQLCVQSRLSSSLAPMDSQRAKLLRQGTLTYTAAATGSRPSAVRLAVEAAAPEVTLPYSGSAIIKSLICIHLLVSYRTRVTHHGS